MGRKDLTQERTQEILDAFARAIVKHGLDASLELVAQEAGMTRSIIRHYIGNREDVVNTLVARITQDTVADLDVLLTTTPHDQQMTVALDALFGVLPINKTYDKLIIDVMMTGKERYPDAKRSLLTMFDRLVALLERILEQAYPQAGPERCRGVAYSIFCMSMSHDSLLWIGMDPAYNRAVRANAEALITLLATSA